VIASAPRPRSAAVDALLAGLGDARGPGAAVGVVAGGRVLHRGGHGLADVEHEAPWTPDRPTRIASLTKQFTAALLLALEDEGRLDLDDHVAVHVPELAHLEEPVTLRQLLACTSGLHVDEGLAWLAGNDLTHPCSLEYYLRLVARQRRPMAPPGHAFQYNDTGFRLAVLAAERATGRPVDALARERLLAPLGMRASAFVPDGAAVIPGLASTYRVGEGGRLRRYLGQGESTGDGGMVSTLDDLLTWADALARDCSPVPGLTGRLADPPQLPGFGTSPYGLGVWVGEHRGLRFLAHSGTGFAYCFLLAVPERTLGVVCLGNRSDLEARKLAFAVADLFLEAPPGGPPSAQVQFEASAPQPGAAPRGRYASAQRGWTLDLEARGDVLRATLLGCTAHLRNVGGGRWRAVEGALSLRVDASRPERPAAALGAETAQLAPAVPRVLPERDARRLLGLYVSAELEATVRVAQAEHGLELWLGGASSVHARLALTALGDELLAGEAVAVRAAGRGADGSVSDLRVDHGRARGLRYRRVTPPEGAPA